MAESPAPHGRPESGEQPKAQDIGRFLASLRPFLKPHRLLVTGIVLGLVVESAFTTLLSMSLKLLVDHAIAPQDQRLLWWLVAGLTAGLALAVVVMIWRDWLYARLGAAVIHDVRKTLFNHLQTLSLGFFSRSPAGALLSRFTTDLAAIENVVVGALPNIVSSVLSIGFLLTAMMLLEMRLALLSLVLVPLCWMGPHWLLQRAGQAGALARQNEAQVIGAVQENISAQPMLKAFVGEAQAMHQFGGHLQRFADSHQRFNFLSYSAERLPNIAMISVHVLVLAVGSQWAFAGQLSVGSLVAFHALLLSLGAAVAMLSSNLPTLLQAATGMQRIDEVLAEQPAVAEKPSATPLPPFAHEIALENVGFSWGPSRILDGLSLTIRRGSTVALVGPSGSGKSTVLSLLARFHDPQSGQIRVDNHDLRDVRIDSLREQMSMVLQDNTLMEASVRENMRLARPDATDDDIRRAAALAAADSFIRVLPQGYDTLLGAAGVHLSGGQRQRLAIAQALVREPRILLLDEATSALDPGTERRISTMLGRRDGQRTVVMVTHNLEQARACEKILVLDAGRLVEQGAHEELLAADGLYARLWRKQHGIQVSDDLEEAHLSADWLAEVELFRGADPALLTELAAQFSVERLPGGHDVLQQGEPGDRFYVIARGTVSVRRRDPGMHRARELARLHVGDAFGETALLSDAPRNATIHAVSDCLFLTMERSRFRHWLARDPDLKRRVLALSARR